MTLTNNEVYTVYTHNWQHIFSGGCYTCNNYVCCSVDVCCWLYASLFCLRVFVLFLFSEGFCLLNICVCRFVGSWVSNSKMRHQRCAARGRHWLVGAAAGWHHVPQQRTEGQADRRAARGRCCGESSHCAAVWLWADFVHPNVHMLFVGFV